MARTIRLLRQGFAERPEFDTAVSHALLRRAARGEVPESLRLNRPGRVVAFGRQDVMATGYPQAVAAARRGGYAAVERLAGGRAAVFHSGTIAFSWSVPTADPRPAIRDRFEELAAIMAAAFRRLGIDARVGEVAGEYCPGGYSVNAGGRRKLMGVGQRLIAGGAHTGGVVVVDDAAAINAILTPVYAALDFEWDPSATGALSGEVPGIDWEAAVGAITAEFEARYRLVEDELEAATLELAEAYTAEHAPA